ncbi:hypothetical protein [Mastigocoleus sp. MO_188.B34]|uniref:hypothetical protein n=1 Tax=Mastigocoleus sp. MO_188.B34 TaxID=3036635 RepID=UPI002608BB13|nr:hypothetical protein [Mastigocoleus sp. MO_188.B34]MDJ0697201.1 hypothetical protein [Mastigocoleus sp. MO_188.B34]
MSIWIITIGNSDVILKHDKNWNPLYQEVVDDLECQLFSSATPINSDDKSKGYTVPARVLGLVYGNQPDYEKDLDFPLLNTFSQFFADSHHLPEKIIVILTDQQHIFSEDERDCKEIPYWQDTCTLEPIITRYFQDRFPQLQEDTNIKYITLNPLPGTNNKHKGLDDWDKVLSLVQQAFKEIDIVNDKIANNQKTVYVSHQAGTPAISSAVQFISLAKFGKDVQFLVSSEYENSEQQTSKYQKITSSTYLRGIQFQKSKELLERFDYSGVESLLTPYLTNPADGKAQKILSLIKAAQYWNCAKFDEFQKYATAIGDTEQKRSKQWWWSSYEAAYLAVVRLKQGNNVEAVFHSFRALEGLICKWVVVTYPSYVEKNKKKGESFDIKDTILPKVPSLPKFYENSLLRKKKQGLYGDFAYQILLASRPELNKNENLKPEIWNIVRNERNALFHQLLGLEETEVFQAWQTSNQLEWEKRVLGCLNFISGQNFTSLQEASLMSVVHQELKDAIANYE